MYNNIGSKIQTIGILLGWSMLILGFLAGIVLLTNGETVTSRWGSTEFVENTADDIFGYISIISGVLCFVSSWFIVGFGQLIEDTRNTNEMISAYIAHSYNHEAEIMRNGGWNCSCGRVNASYVSTCACGKNKSDK